MKIRRAVVVMVMLLTTASVSQGITNTQVDEFETGTTLNWFSGATFGQVADGGPTGLGDGYLELSRTNFHIAAYNDVQWVGDYNGAGVGALRLDANPISVTAMGQNPGAILGLRLVLFGPGGAFTSTDASILDPGWNSYIFDLNEMIFLSGSGSGWPGGGTGVLADTLAAVSRLLIRNDFGPTPTPIGFHPPHVTATLGLDNIKALPQGDVNGDGFVGGDDLSKILTNWGLSGQNLEGGDLDGDGFIGGGDYSEALTYWGSGTPLEAVPEPAALGLMLAGSLALLRPRTRRG